MTSKKGRQQDPARNKDIIFLTEKARGIRTGKSFCMPKVTSKKGRQQDPCAAFFVPRFSFERISLFVLLVVLVCFLLLLVIHFQQCLLLSSLPVERTSLLARFLPPRAFEKTNVVHPLRHRVLLPQAFSRSGGATMQTSLQKKSLPTWWWWWWWPLMTNSTFKSS